MSSFRCLYHIPSILCCCLRDDFGFCPCTCPCACACVCADSVWRFDADADVDVALLVVVLVVVMGVEMTGRNVVVDVVVASTDATASSGFLGVVTVCV